MKKVLIIKNIAIALLVAMFAVACDRNAADDLKFASEGEGAVKFSFNISAPKTKAAASALDNSILRIYQEQGGEYKLIRVNSPATELESILYLMAGQYKVTLEVGVDKEDAVNATFDKNDLLYYGEKEFTVAASKVSVVNLNCKTLYSAVKIIYQADSLFNAKFDQGVSTLVNVCDVFTNADGTPSLEFIESDTVGYYLLPQGVSNLAWQFTGKSTELGNVIKSGVIENPQAATLYSLTFKYSKNADGVFDLTISVDENYDVFDDTYSFSLQPIVEGDGIGNPFNFVDNAAVYNITSINPLSTIKLNTQHIDGTPYELVIDETTDLTGTGLVYTKTDDEKATLTIEKAFFDKYQFGGAKEIEFVATDDAGAEGTAKAMVNITGITEAPIADLWTRTLSFKAIVTDLAVTTANILYKATGDADWTTIPATKEADGTFSAALVPTWTASKNAGNLTVSTISGGVKVGTQYEYKLQIASNDILPVRSITTAAGHTMPEANFENASLSCWGMSNNSTTIWGSGNNSTIIGDIMLCKQGTYNGMTDSKCAYLIGSQKVGNLAAGNVFLGQFSISGTTGTVRFGQEFDWQSKPSKIKLKYAAEIGNVDIKKSDVPGLNSGDKDKGRIFFAIVDWNSRHEVKAGTNGKPSGVWDPEKQNKIGTTDDYKIIGYASAYITESVTGTMKDLELDIYYYDKVTKPSKSISIVFSGATSAYGDYMVGCSTSKMWIDDIQFVY